MPVSFKDLHAAYQFVDASHIGENEAFLCRLSGKIYWRSGYLDDVEELPDDIDDDEKYLQIPGKKDLELGVPLVLDFVRHCLPGDLEETQRIFRSKGAYGKFKRLLSQRGALDRWYDFEAKAEEKALRVWCQVNSIDVVD